ncbi:MAG TPA: 50S ribosomal protein L4 [Thermodesulfovibrionales bacterium]|nr:50S ribosomal protein L4 [Thermodesulfovibrionales bacterium]
MPDIELKDTSNKVKGTVSLPEEMFGFGERKDILHASVVTYLANQRQGTHATKTKGLVSGGGKKPWKQKHTGRARAGSSRSPLWRKGGTVFGPQPRDYALKLPRSLKRRALAEALSAKLTGGEIMVVESITVDKPKTKTMVEVLRNLGLDGKSVLIVIPGKDHNILLASRNIPRVDVERVTNLNSYQILTHDRILMTRDAVSTMTEVCKQ